MSVAKALREGTWLTPARLRGYAVLLIALYLVLIAAVLATAHGKLDLTGRALGTDFSQVWVAGRSVLAGDAAAPFDPLRHLAAQRAAFGPRQGFYGWLYPPYFLAIAATLALLPYLLALLVWQAGSLAAYLTVTYRLLPGRSALLGAAAFPGVIVNLGHGQNGFLSAALMGGALLCLRHRPILAGALFALLAYKPQFGLAIPIALIAGRQWRALAGACVVLAVMTLATLWAFGLSSWAAFLSSLAVSRSAVLVQDGVGWEKMLSVFAACRMWGGGVRLAAAVQIAVSLAVLAATAWVWRGPAVDIRARGAALLTAALLTTPYCMDYDSMLLAPALALLASLAQQRGFLPWERTLLAGIWASPLLARLVAGAALVPLGLAAVIGLFMLTLRHARADAPAMACV